MSEQKRLEQAEADAEEALFVLQTQLQTAVGHLARLRRQKRFLRERVSELFRRGMQSLDELEAEDCLLESAEAQVVTDVQEFGACDPVDWSSLVLDLSEADLAAVSVLGPAVDPGSSDGTLLVSPGRRGHLGFTHHKRATRLLGEVA